MSRQPGDGLRNNEEKASRLHASEMAYPANRFHGRGLLAAGALVSCIRICSNN